MVEVRMVVRIVVRMVVRMVERIVGVGMVVLFLPFPSLVGQH